MNYNNIQLICYYFSIFAIGVSFSIRPKVLIIPQFIPNPFSIHHLPTHHSPCQTEYYDRRPGYCVPGKECCSSFNSDSQIVQKGTCKNGQYCCTYQIYCQGCEEGYKKENDTCVDINECVEKYGVCSGHKCINTNGSYECECFDGFEMIGNLKTCKHTNHSEISDLIFSASLTINLMPFNTTNAAINESNVGMLYSGTVFPKSIDYSFSGNYMAWTDITLKQITIAPINYRNPSLIMNVKFLRYLKNPNKLSIDWIHDLIYWTDFEMRAINVLYIHKPEDYYTIINTTDNIPNDLLVNVLDSCLIWTYIDIQSRIMRSNQDGTQITQIYGTFKHPFHLTIDTILKRYLFIDIEDSTLYSIDFNGKDERKHFQSKKLLISINSALIYGDNIYLLTDSLFYSLNKFGHNFNETVIASKLSSSPQTLNGYLKNKQLFDFKILDPILQPQLENKCQFTKCSHLCLPSDQTQKFQCFCPENYILVNKTVCIQKNTENIVLQSMERITNNLEAQRGNGQQVLLVLILITMISILIILLIIGFKWDLFRMKIKVKYWSPLKGLYHKTDDNSNSIEETESKT